MKRWFRPVEILICISLILSIFIGCGKSDVPEASPAQPTVAPEPAAATPAAPVSGEEIVMKFLGHLFSNEYDAAAAMFATAPMDQVNAMGGMEAFMEMLQQQSGILVSLDGQPVQVATEPDRAYSTPCTTQTGRYNIMVAIDGEGLVAGFGLVSMSEDPITMPEGAMEEAVTVDAGKGYPLEGFVVKPADTSTPAPLVLLVQGSGATDYDEIVGANRVFGKLAKGLAERGIATLRYSKRNYAWPEITQANDYSIKEEYVEDVLAAVALAKTIEGVDPSRIFILGHSQGGMLAPMFIREGADVAGMILFAGTPRSLLDIMDDQQADILAYYEAIGLAEQVQEYKENQQTWKAERDALKKMTAEEAKNAGTVYGMGAYYLYVLEQFDAIDTIKELKKPTLILQGGNDRQVYADVDFALYKEALGDKSYVRLKLYEGLNHIFMPSVANNIMEAVNEYSTPAEIPDEIFRDIAAWISEN